MREVREVQIGDHKIKFYELTVAEIRDWFKDQESNKETDVIDLMLFDEMNLQDLYRITDLTQEAAGDMTPSELAQVIAIAKEINQSFFGILARVMTSFHRAMVETQAATS